MFVYLFKYWKLKCKLSVALFYFYRPTILQELLEHSFLWSLGELYNQTKQPISRRFSHEPTAMASSWASRVFTSDLILAKELEKNSIFSPT